MNNSWVLTAGPAILLSSGSSLTSIFTTFLSCQWLWIKNRRVFTFILLWENVWLLTKLKKKKSFICNPKRVFCFVHMPQQWAKWRVLFQNLKIKLKHICSAKSIVWQDQITSREGSDFTNGLSLAHLSLPCGSDQEGGVQGVKPHPGAAG